jgi:hypothetical protein
MDCVVQGKRVEIRLHAPHVAAVDAWRRDQPDLPPRAEAVVRLMELGLKVVSKKKKARPEPKK